MKEYKKLSKSLKKYLKRYYDILIEESKLDEIILIEESKLDETKKKELITNRNSLDELFLNELFLKIKESISNKKNYFEEKLAENEKKIEKLIFAIKEIKTIIFFNEELSKNQEKDFKKILENEAFYEFLVKLFNNNESSYKKSNIFGYIIRDYIKGNFAINKKIEEKERKKFLLKKIIRGGKEDIFIMTFEAIYYDFDDSYQYIREIFDSGNQEFELKWFKKSIKDYKNFLNIKSKECSKNEKTKLYS